MALRVVILGAGGHARSLARHLNSELIAPIVYITDDNEVRPDDEVHIGVGDMAKRRRLFNQFKDQIPNNGIQLMAKVHVGPDVQFGENVLVNTGAQIDHDCRIGAHSIIAPGAILCGGVTVGENCFVGAGAIIIQGVELEPDTFVPAGTLVCGSTDMRMPQRLVSPQRANDAFMGEVVGRAAE